RKRMRGLERGDDPFEPSEIPECLQRSLVRRTGVFGPAAVAQRRMLGPDARIVEPGRDRMCVDDLTVAVCENGRARTVENGCVPRSKRRGSGGLDADQPHVVSEEAGEDADRVRAAADAGDDDLRQAALRL